jgi:DNA-binding NarL/FixJ family response regulator
MALNLDDEEIVYFLENDYLHKPEADKVLQSAFDMHLGIEYVTLYDHPDKYMEPGNGGVDIILSDIEMPQLDGLALCKIVKNHKEYSNIPFVFFSSLINEQMKKKCDALKADAAFSKPEINQIVSSIEALCKQYQKGFVIAEEGTVQS